MHLFGQNRYILHDSATVIYWGFFYLHIQKSQKSVEVIVLGPKIHSFCLYQTFALNLEKEHSNLQLLLDGYYH